MISSLPPRLILLFLSLLASGCTTLLTPQYAPKSEVALHGSAQVGKVRYLPHEQDGFGENQLDDSTVGNIELSEPVADFVRRALASELKASGVTLAVDAPLLVSAAVDKFEVGSFGFQVEWRVQIRIGILRRADGKLLFDGTFRGQLRHGKLVTWELSGMPSAVVAQALRAFVEQDEVQRLLR